MRAALIATSLLCALAVLGGCGGGDEPKKVPPRFGVYDWEPNLVTGDNPPHGVKLFTVKHDGREVVLRNIPSLDGRDLAAVRAGTDKVTKQPAVFLTLTPAGRAKLHGLTKSVARRGRSGTPNHFAIIVGSDVVSLPAIDPKALPDGLDGRKGLQIEGGMDAAQTQTIVERIEAAR